MKKKLLIAMAVFTVVAFTACKKEGVYKPGNKITKIYSSSHWEYSYYSEYSNGWTTTTSETPKYLREKWKWDGKLLKSIERYDSDGKFRYSIDIKYDGKRIEKIERSDEDNYIEYSYDGRKLEKIEHYYEGMLNTEVEVEHDGNKITELKYTYYDNKKSSSHFDDMMEISMRMFMPNEEAARHVADVVKKASKGGTEVWTVSIDWDGKNISEVVSNESGSSHKHTYKYEYDDNKNPYKGFVLELGEEGEELCLYGSKNNVTKETSTCSESDDGPEVTTYSYDYDGKWPTKQTCTNSYSGENSRSTYTYITYFEYDD